jgi:polyhydroxyalkanoate synthesis regulator phasin
MGAFTNLATLGLNFALAQQAARQESSDINRERDRQIRDIQARNEEERRRQQVLRGLTEEADAAQQASDDATGGRIADLRRRAIQAR